VGKKDEFLECLIAERANLANAVESQEKFLKTVKARIDELGRAISSRFKFVQEKRGKEKK
jgi:hypothetical protein